MPAATSLQPLPLHAHGVPNWIDLHTQRIDEARSFYEALLGWTFRNRVTLTAVPDDATVATEPSLDVGSGTVTALSNELPVAELVQKGKAIEDIALLSTWFPYIYVDDLEATLKLVESSGGLVINPPVRRGSMATVATILDPNDALLNLWEPIRETGSDSIHRPGSLTWIELETADIDAAKKFYGELFGWDAGDMPLCSDLASGGSYTVFTKNGDRVAGAVETALTGIPASWCPSFAVTDVDVAVKVSARNGGVLMAEPIDMPVGRQAVLVDPTGAAFSVLGPKNTGPRPL